MGSPELKLDAVFDLSLDVIEKEIKTHSKRCDELQDFITHLQKELEQANNDRNAEYGALQQCLKFKGMFMQSERVETKGVVDGQVK